MTEDAVAALRSEVGADPPPGLVAVLADGELERLTGLVRNAKRSQTAALNEAGDRALSHLPKLLRIAVERALG